MRQLNLQNEKTIEITNPEYLTFDTIQIVVAKDYGNRVEVELMLKNSVNELQHEMQLLLWDGQSYIDIGEWTDADVNDRIIELMQLL